MDADEPWTLVHAERVAIVRAMQRADGVKTVAARLLGCGKSTLYRKLREHGLATEFDAESTASRTTATENPQ